MKWWERAIWVVLWCAAFVLKAVAVAAAALLGGLLGLASYVMWERSELWVMLLIVLAIIGFAIGLIALFELYDFLDQKRERA